MIMRRNHASRLRHKLTLQIETRSADDVGGYIRSWSDVVELWAEINPVSGGEKLFGGQLQPEITHKILLRYRDDINSGMRLKFENRVFNIRYVINVAEKNEVLEILATEGVAT